MGDVITQERPYIRLGKQLRPGLDATQLPVPPLWYPRITPNYFDMSAWG